MASQSRNRPGLCAEARPLSRRPAGTSAPSPALGLPEEELAADARGGMTPAQMVDQKLLVLLDCGTPGLYR